MSIYVLDSSFCAALFLPDEKSKHITSLIDRLTDDDQVFVPQLWWYEISNILIVAVKRKRLSHRDTVQVMRLWKQFNIETDQDFGESFSENIFELGQLYDLSAYDAAYLELALRKQAKLGSLDKKLQEACEKTGIILI